jgi:sterol desaturase/sphingolipid hydroxylase (fatty acid hydroxylase superfamily)
VTAALPFALWLAWSVPALAVLEYLLHRYPMHRPGWPLARGVFRRHAVLHHRHARNDVNLDTPAWWGLLLSAPLWGGLLLIGCPGGAAAVALAVAAYCLLWTGVHRATHGLGSGWARRLPWYARWERHHLDHHAHPGSNFGAAFGPLTDAVFGTLHRPGRGPT